MTQEEKRNFERAQRSYAETQKRRQELTGKDKKLFELIESVDIGNYSPSLSEVLVIANVYNNSAINSSLAFLRLGFLKGQRAEKARQKKKRQSTNA